MINAVIYDAASGEVVKVLTSPDLDCVTANVQVDQGYIVSDWPDDIENYVVSDGALSRKPQSEIDERIAEEQVIKLRGQRDALLMSSDWTQMPDSPLSDAKKQEWATYRQELRDLPSTADPANPTWPSKPS
jgi:hypothetical protein